MTTDRTARWLVAAVMVAATWAARAQNEGAAQPQVAQLLVPVVGAVENATRTRWRTDLELRNDSRNDADVWLILAGAPDQPAINVPMAAGARVRFEDIVGQTFGLEATVSPLIVTTSGRRSVSVNATVLAIREGAIVSVQPIGLDFLTDDYPLRLLQGLNFSDEFRTNVGLVNLGDRPAEFTLALQRIPGRNLAVTRVTLPPNANWHVSIQTLFPLITNGNNFSLVVETRSPQTFVYASVIENATDAARFIQPSVAAGSGVRAVPEPVH
jgi:hypothetical protein